MTKKEGEDFLIEGEKVLYQASVHKAVFIWPGTIALMAFLVGIFFHPFVGISIAILGLYPAFNALIRHKTTLLVLTDKRLLTHSGFFSKDRIQLRLDKIESANWEESIAGRMIGYATVIIRGTGTGFTYIPYITDAKPFVKKLEKVLLDRGEPKEPS